MMKKWSPGAPPALRGKGRTTCPFCDDETLILSYGDVPDDDSHIELYCLNPECCARDIHILANAGHDRLTERADYEALCQVDNGPAAERNPDGWHMWSGGSLLKEDMNGLRLRRRCGEAVPCQCDTCQGRALAADG
jgi:hypothetical protein